MGFSALFQIMIMKLKFNLGLIGLGIATSVAVAGPLPKSPESMRILASSLEKAGGTQQNYEEAYRLYCLAALKGDAESNYNLGWMYFNGRGLKYDIGLAMGWFQRGAKLGDTHAKNMIKRFPKVSPKTDKACFLPKSGVATNRSQTEAWVRVIAPKFEIDPELVLAVIHAESNFNAKALSSKNAQGLMQLIPATAKRFGVVDSWNPVANIIGGTAYLHWLMRHFSGDVKLVLAGYNAGERAVEKYKGIPPYRETKHYVKRIIRRYKKTSHPVPSNIGALKDYASEVMLRYATTDQLARVKRSKSLI